MNEERLHKLWENTGRLNSKFTIDYDTFKNDMNDIEKRHRFYESVRKLNPKFTVTAEQADIDLGFISEQLSPEQEVGTDESEDLAGHKKRNGYQTMIDSHTSFAEKHIKEQEEKKAQQAKVQDNYMNAGLSEQDKTDRAEYEKLMSDKAMNKISETFGIEQSKVNQYGMPVVEPAKEEADLTTISRPRTVGTGEEVIPFKSSEQKVDEKIAAMPSYITRGEDDTHKINANAFERALNTKEGKELYKQIFDNEAFLFKHSNEGMALLEQYRNGEISEEDFERIFREKVGPAIDEEFLGEITSEGGIMRDYFVVAREKLGKDTSKKGANAVDYAIQEYELEKEKEFDNEVREAYKEKYGVYPEEDKSVRYNAANDGFLLRWRRLEDIKSSVREQEQTGYRTSDITGETKKYRKDLPQILQISGAKEFNEDAKEIIDAVENKGLGDFFKAFGRTASDMDTWDLGISALLRNGALLEVVEKADRKEKLTREEQLLMDAALNYMAVSAFYSNSLGRGYKAGTTSAASIPFMIQFALSAGALSAMEASLAGSAKAAGTKIINALAKHGMQKMANVAASEATKAIGKASVGMLSSLIGAGALTAAWDIPSIASGSIERQIGGITPVYNKEGNAFVYGGREHKQSSKEAAWNAFADKYVERLSEMVLAKTFAPIEAYASGTRMFKNMAKNDVIGAILDIRNTPFIKGLREKAMFGGLFEEMMEEELGGLLRMATMSDVNTFKEAGLDMDGQIDIFLGLAPTSLLFSVGGTASHYGKLAVRSKKLRDSLVTDAERKLFDNLMSESRSGKFGELAHDFIRNVILADRTKDGRKITNEDKRDALITVLTKYQDVLSEELKSQTRAVKKEENDAAIDNAVQNMRYKKTDDIFFVKDENGKKYVIVDGNVGFNQIQGGLVVDSSRSDSHVSVREVLGNGRLGKVEKVRTASLTDNVHPMSTQTYTEWNQAKHQAEVDEKETFEYKGIVFDTATSKRLGTKEEYEKKKKEDEAIKNDGKPTINTEPRKMSDEKFQLVVDGKKQSVTFCNAGLVQNEDGSINEEDSDLFIIEANGEKVSRRNQEEYINALSEHLKSEHAKAIEEYNQKQNASDNVEPEVPTTALTDEDRAAAAAEQERMAKEAEKQSVLASAQQKKAKKYTPEEAVVVLMEQGNDVATRLVGSRINKLRTQIDEINADENKDELEKWEDSKELSDQLAEYEAAVVKWLGQETLDAINATRVAPAAPVVEAAPVEEGPAVPPVQAQAVEPAQVEEPAEPDTTPLPPAEPETRVATIEPIDLGGDDIVFVSNSSNVTRVAQRKEDGNLYFVDNGKPVSNAWKETASKVKVYYNGRPYYLLSKTARIGKNGSVVGLNITVHLAPEMYTGKDSELNEIPRDKISLDEQGNQTATGNKLAERVANYKSLSDFFNKVIYNAGGVKLTLGELLEIPVVNANKGKGAPSWQFQVKRFIEQQEGKRNQTDVRADIEAGLKELIADWNAYVKANGLTDVVTEDNATDYYSRLKELGGYTSNGLLVQSTDFNGGKLNSADATKNPILQLLVMLDQASELASEKGPSLRALEVSNIRGYVQKKPSSMTTEEIEAEMFLTNNQGERVRNYGISTQRYNALNAELERRQAPEREAQGQLEKELNEKERNQEEQLIDSYANEIVNLLAASSNGNAIQKAAARGRVIDTLKGNSTLRKGVYDKLASMQNEDSAEVIESAMNLIAKHYPEVAKTSTKKAEQEKPKPATSTPSLKELNDEYNDIKSKLDEYYYETEEEIDSANKRLAELRTLLENTEFMIGDVLTEHAESTKRIIKILKAAGIRVVTFKNDELPKYVSKKKLEELSDGQIVYGFASNDTIYLNEDHFNPNSPLHEFTHLWVTAYKQAFPNEWKRFVEIANKSALAANLRKPLKDGKASPYAKLNADEMASEVLSRYTGYLYGELDTEGRTAFENMMQAQTMEEKMAEKSLLNRIRNIWKKIISWFDKSIENEKNEDAIDGMIRQFAQAPMETLARGKDAVDELKQSVQLEESYNPIEDLSLDREIAQEMANIQEKAKIDGTYMKAPNGESSNLTPRQWLEVRTKTFKEWFGEWETVARAKAILMLTPVAEKQLDKGQTYESAYKAIGEVIHKSENIKVKFFKTAFDKIAKEGGLSEKAIPSLKECFEKSILAYSESDNRVGSVRPDGTVHKKHPNVSEVRNYVGKVMIDNIEHFVRFTVNVQKGNTGVHSYFITEVSLYNNAANGLSGSDLLGSRVTNSSITDAKLQQFFETAKQLEKKISKILDENGEPLVVYHGSRMAGFDQFGRGEARDSQGIYTTPNRRAAESYATSIEEWKSGQTMPEAELGVPDHHGVYSLFVNMRNPKVIDFGGKRFDEYGEPKYEVATNEALDNGERGILFDTLEEAEAYIAEHPEEDLDYVEKRTTSDDMLVQAKEEGYDGVIFTNIIDSRYPDPITNYVPFESNQVKSATQNIGTFNAYDNRIEFMIGPAAPAGSPITDPTLMLDEEALKALEVKSKKYAAKLANPKVQLPEEIDGMFVAKNFDRTEGIRRIMNSIAEYRKAHGMPKMGEGFDVRTMIEAKDSKINNKIASFDNNQVKRLEKIVRKWAKVIEKSAMYEKYKNEQMRNQDGEVTTLTPIEFLERYLIACDSIEREALTKNPRGIGGFLNRMGINVVQFHNEFVSEFASDTNGKKMREELWEAVRGVTRVTLEVGKESGLISQEEYDKDIKRQFYVPERDFAEVEANKQLWIEGAAWRKSKRGARLRAMQKSKEKGGLSLAANILSNMLDLTYDAIAKAEENKVKVAMFDLLSANEAWCNENRVPVPVRVWYEKDADGKPVRRTTEPSRSERDEMKKYKGKVRKLENLILNETDKKLIYESKIDELKEELKKSHTPEERLEIETNIRELEKLILQINDNIDEWHEDIDVYTSMYPYMDTIDVRNILFETKEQQKAETVIAYVDGVPCEMHFPNMQIVADVLNNVSYNDWYFDDIKKVTSYASAIFTVYNPTFFTVNLARDIPWILKKGYSEYGWEFPVRFAAKLIAETFSSTLWKAVAGKDYSDSIYAEHMKEFYEGGGNTGYTQLPEMQRIKKHVAKWGEKKLITWGDVGNVMSFMNEWSEVLTRSAAYSVIRDMGYNQEEGIRAAKNLSVNFNRKGLGSKFMNLFSSFSMFANAVVQGACGFYRTFKPNEDTQLQRAMHVTRAVMSIGLAPAFAGFISTLLQPDDEDDFLVSDWERDNYFILGNVRIPLSEQLKPFWCIGVNIALGMHGKRNGKDIARSLTNSFFVNLVPAPNSFNSTLQMFTDAIFGYKDFSGAALVDNLLTPQVLKNTNSIANNSNFMGGKFRYDYGDTPEFVMGENDPYIYRCIAKLAYNMAGGDEYVKSTSVKEVNEYGEVEYVPMSKAMNINPKQIEAWASVFVPSGFRDIANAVAVTIGKIAGDEDAKFKPKEFNSVTRFYKQQDKEMNQYFLLKDIKKEIDYYTSVKSTAKKNIIGAEIAGNEEWLESAETKFESLSNNTLKQIEASLIEQYDKLHMDKIARKYALTGDKLKEHLSDKEIIKIDKERDNILRKILILDMERKGNELFTYDDFEKEQKYSEEEKRDILESQIYNEVRKKRPK